MQNSDLIEKIQSLPLETINEVEDFVDFLTQKQTKQNGERDSANERISLQERGISRKEAAEQRANLNTFVEDWELPAMEIYDEL